MAAKTQDSLVKARVDERTKSTANTVLGAMDLTMSDVLRELTVRIAQEKDIPFPVRTTTGRTVMPKTTNALVEMFSPELHANAWNKRAIALQAQIKAARKDLKLGESTSPKLEALQSELKDLAASRFKPNAEPQERGGAPVRRRGP